MDAAFPFGFPFATGFYYVFYVITLAIHVAFMNYVLAGTGYLAVARLLTGRSASRTSLMMDKLADWLPFALSAAITAGVAPLLFVQILFKQSFYTANLLLFHRWMSIVPVLIVGFYLLYLWKSRPAGRWPVYVRAAIGATAFGCFAFTAYSWTENHLLSVQDQATWSQFYASDAMVYTDEQIVPRLAVWYTGAFPTMSVLLAWQMWAACRRDPGQCHRRDVRVASMTAFVGLVATGLCGTYYFRAVSPEIKEAIGGPLAAPYMYLAITGMMLQAVAWAALAVKRVWHTLSLVVASVGLGLSLLATTVVREAVRLSAVDITALYPQHEQAWAVGGLFVFLAFFVFNAVAIGIVLVAVRRSPSPAA